MSARTNMQATAWSALGLGLTLLAGCASEELGGAQIPNARPDTRITAQPPNLLEAGFVVKFEWTGNDPDGRVRGFQWRLSDNGIDGIGIQDTLTVDPATGDTLNPWHFTTATDTTLLVSANLDSFPPDVIRFPGNPLDPNFPDWRSYQTHSFFVRCVDEEGAVDETPDYVSFTATTLVPTILVDKPAGLNSSGVSSNLPPMIRLRYTGGDGDFEMGYPTQVRYLLKQARLSGGEWVNSRYLYNQHFEELVSWDDPAWGDWLDYSTDAALRVAEFPDTPAGQRIGGAWEQYYYLFAIQARDTSGAVSVDRVYGRNVMNLHVNNAYSPALTYRERFLGGTSVTGIYHMKEYEIAQTQAVEYSWSASADYYFGEIVGYRYGWNVRDLNDDLDPGWQGYGNAAVNRRTQPHLFTPGDNSLVIEAYDSAGQMTRATIRFVVVIVLDPPPEDLLLVDDNDDHQSNGWPSTSGTPQDTDLWRDSFWYSALDPAQGGPSRFVWDDNAVDLRTGSLAYSDIVDYANILWHTSVATTAFLGENFRPNAQTGEAPFNWLLPYQQGVGNLMMCGSGAMHQFIELVEWLEPIMFDNDDKVHPSGGYRIGFGREEMPDGTEYRVGPTRYPYAGWGISCMDVFQPSYKVFGWLNLAGKQARSGQCTGMKALNWDEDFAATRLSGVPADFPLDTIFTEGLIDWKDLRYGYLDSLREYLWVRDEFYELNVTSRGTPYPPVMVEVPGTGETIAAVEPMFRALSRFDWIDQYMEEHGNPDWPPEIFPGNIDLDDKCGWAALATDPETRELKTVTNGTVVGLVSHQADPLGPGSVLWGFDPYRFNHYGIKKVIRWVLREHFGLE